MSNLDQVFEGRAWKFGDSVDTNQLAGGGLQGSNAEETLRINCLRGLREEFTEHVAAGDVIVAGRNFGCGSSRQTAVQALQLCGVAVVLAETVARIFRRNSIALALPTFAVGDVCAFVDDGDIVRVEYEGRSLVNVSRGTRMQLPGFSPSVEAVYRAGGIRHVMLARLAQQGIHPETS